MPSGPEPRARPFVTFGGARELPVVLGAGLRPLGAVMGLSAMRYATSGGTGTVYAGDERRKVVDAFERVIRLGRERLVAEATALGAAFVADVELAFPLEFATAVTSKVGTFRATGTAYAALGVHDEAVPTNLSGLELARVLAAGYVPTGLCFGYSFWYQTQSYRSGELEQSGALGPFGRNVEHPDYTMGTKAAWTLALARLEREVRDSGGEGALGFQTHLHTVKENALSIVVSATAVRRGRTMFRGLEPALGLSLGSIGVAR